MEQTFRKLVNHETLSKEKAYELLMKIILGKCNETQIAGLLSIFCMRKLTLDELMGFQDAMMDNCISINFSDEDLLDFVGTGGDKKNTFNISTTASIITAGAGIKIAKHGNYASSSISGSSDVLQYLGYKFTSDQSILNQQLASANICFLHAPLFHPLMKNVAAIRKNLGFRTFFNSLGPIVNPASPSIQFLGVNSISCMRIYQYLLQERGIKQFSIVNSLDGYDEISLTGAFKIITSSSEQLVNPEDINIEKVMPNEIEGGSTVKEAANIMMQILMGNGTPAQNRVAIVNSAFAIQCSRPNLILNDCIELAKESLFSGKAFNTIKKIINN